MRIARDLAQHGAQPEPFRGVVAGGFHPAIVEYQPLGPAAFERKVRRHRRHSVAVAQVTSVPHRGRARFRTGGSYCRSYGPFLCPEFRAQFFDLNQKKRPFAAMVFLVSSTQNMVSNGDETKGFRGLVWNYPYRSGRSRFNRSGCNMRFTSHLLAALAAFSALPAARRKVLKSLANRKPAAWVPARGDRTDARYSYGSTAWCWSSSRRFRCL